MDNLSEKIIKAFEGHNEMCLVDVMTGDINVGGLVIGKEFDKKDAMNLSEDIAEVEVSIKGNVFVTLKKKYDGVKIEISIWNDDSPNEISIIPELLDTGVDPEIATKALLEESKKWLRKHIVETPSEESEYAIVYKFEWGKIIAMCIEDLHYGLTGGEISVTY